VNSAKFPEGSVATPWFPMSIATRPVDAKIGIYSSIVPAYYIECVACDERQPRSRRGRTVIDEGYSDVYEDGWVLVLFSVA
jgi:hypothetical protein